MSGADKEISDVTIIGGGPAGLYAAFYAGLRELRVKLIEAQPELGGKLHVYPEKLVWDVGGQPPILAGELIRQLVTQGLTFGPEVVLNERVTSISRTPEGHFLLDSASGRRHLTRTVIIAIGSGILKPQRIQLEGAEAFEMTNLHYTVKSLSRFAGKTVLISGGGNSALDWANTLEPLAKQVHVALRRDAFTGHEAAVTQLQRSSVRCHFQTALTRLLARPDGQGIGAVELTDQTTGEASTLEVEEVLIHHGFERDASLLEGSPLPLELSETGCIACGQRNETSVPGIYAAGDIVHSTGKLYLITGAFQDAANAVNQAKRYLQPSAEQAAVVSSHNELLQDRNRAILRELKPQVQA